MPTDARRKLSHSSNFTRLTIRKLSLPKPARAGPNGRLVPTSKEKLTAVTGEPQRKEQPTRTKGNLSLPDHRMAPLPSETETTSYPNTLTTGPSGSEGSRYPPEGTGVYLDPMVTHDEHTGTNGSDTPGMAF